MPELISQSTSPRRQDADRSFRVLAKHHDQGALLPSHQHQAGQLLFAVSGTMLVESRSTRWTVPPQRALWIPSKHEHAITMLSEVELRTVYFDTALVASAGQFALRNEVHAVVASTLIRELVLGLFEPERVEEMRVLMASLILHALGEVACLSTNLPMPQNERLHELLLEMMATHRWHWSMAEIAHRCAMSERSLSRHFTTKLGLSYRAWHQRARIVASLDLLASKRPVKSVAHTLGFSSAAAYVAAFRDVLGTTPNTFRESHPSNPGLGKG